MTDNPTTEQPSPSKQDEEISKWRTSHFAFVLTVLTRYHLNIYRDKKIHLIEIGEGIESWDEDDWSLAIDEGRRQLDAQFAELQFITRRASILLPVGSALSLFLAREWVTQSSGSILDILLIAGFLMSFWGAVVMGALIAGRSPFGLSDVRLLTRESSGLRKYLARDYAELVPIGHNTKSARLTHLGTGVAWIVWGAISGGIGLLISYF